MKMGISHGRSEQKVHETLLVGPSWRQIYGFPAFFAVFSPFSSEQFFFKIGPCFFFLKKNFFFKVFFFKKKTVSIFSLEAVLCRVVLINLMAFFGER